MLSLLGWYCVDVALDVADCWLSADWPASWPASGVLAAAGPAPRSSSPAVSARRRDFMSSLLEVRFAGQEVRRVHVARAGASRAVRASTRRAATWVPGGQP